MGQNKQTMMLILCTFFSASLAVSSAWRPIVPAQLSTSILHQEAAAYDDSGALSGYNLEEAPIGHHQILGQHDDDQCALYKVAMNQQLYFEYIHYKTDLPDLKEFTLCMWTKFTNHTNNHPLFSYAVGDQPRGILSWIANTARSSYYMMNIDGHNIYRLNYPLRLNKWYHSCQSWNGRTGEWQIWVNDERVGRGFNNRLVGHVIKGGGIAISGQEQRQLGGGFLEGEGAPAGSGGMLGELTMVQLYDVALTAGKAHKDHKHHHAHHYEHDTSNNRPRTTTQAPVTGPPLPRNPFITGGQINHRVKINPGAHIQVVQNGVTLRHPSLPPPGPPPMSFPPINPEALQPAAAPAPQPQQPSALPSFASAYRPATQFFSNGVPAIAEAPTGGEPVNGNGFAYIDAPQYRNLFKREKNIAKRQSDTDDDEAAASEAENFEAEKEVVKRETSTGVKVSFVPKDEQASKSDDEKSPVKRETEKKKRGLVQLSDGSLIDDTFLVPQTLNNEYFTGLASFAAQMPKQMSKDEEREPAEAEVKMVMDVCSGCAEEPFAKALVMGWRSVPKKLYSGALYLPAAQACKAF